MRTPSLFFARAARLAAAAALVTLAIAAPRAAAAQADQIYGPSDLTTKPRLASPAQVSRLVTDAYPSQLKRAGIGGTVEVEFVVGTDGKVEPGSAQVVNSTMEALSAPAKSAVEKFSFKPAEVNGQKVRARVALPIIFKAG